MANLTFEEMAFLEYVYDRAGRSVWERVDVPQGPSSGGDMREVAASLREAGLLKEASIAGDVYITQIGLNTMDAIRQQRRDRPARADALRTSLIQWLYDFYIDETQGPTITLEFKDLPSAYYVGQKYSDREIEQAVTFLEREGLVEGLKVDQTPHLIRPHVTSLGVRCAESRKTVSEFLNSPQQTGAPVFHVKIEGSQNIAVGTQTGFTQNISTSVDPKVIAELVNFAKVARQSLPGFELNEQQEEAVKQLSQELEAVASEGSADKSRLKKLTEFRAKAVAPAAGTALGDVVVELGKKAVSAISG